VLQFIGSPAGRRRIAAQEFRRLTPIWLLGFVLAAIVATATEQRSKPAKITPIRLQEVTGEWSEPLSAEGAKAIVFIFVRTDCPISNSYAPKLRRINEAYARKGVMLRLVYPTPDEEAATIRKHLKEYELPFAGYRDPRHELTRVAKASVTPEAAVYAPGKGWIYRGRIDDRHVDFGKARPNATHEDLQDVLEAVVAGKPLKTSATRAVGCTISPLP
jgi:hypothetical protein